MKSLYLLDGMALAYRAHFALIRSPIYTSTGFNTSAIFGFTATLIELITKKKPSHLAVVFDTSAPTKRHRIHPEYKANREDMPEDLSAAMPHLDRVAEAFGIPVLKLDGLARLHLHGERRRRRTVAMRLHARSSWRRSTLCVRRCRGAPAAGGGLFSGLLVLLLSETCLPEVREFIKDTRPKTNTTLRIV